MAAPAGVGSGSRPGPGQNGGLGGHKLTLLARREPAPASTEAPAPTPSAGTTNPPTTSTPPTGASQPSPSPAPQPAPADGASSYTAPEQPPVAGPAKPPTMPDPKDPPKQVVPQFEVLVGKKWMTTGFLKDDENAKLNLVLRTIHGFVLETGKVTAEEKTALKTNLVMWLYSEEFGKNGAFAYAKIQKGLEEKLETAKGANAKFRIRFALNQLEKQATLKSKKIRKVMTGDNYAEGTGIRNEFIGRTYKGAVLAKNFPDLYRALDVIDRYLSADPKVTGEVLKSHLTRLAGVYRYNDRYKSEENQKFFRQVARWIREDLGKDPRSKQVAQVLKILDDVIARYSNYVLWRDANQEKLEKVPVMLQALSSLEAFFGSRDLSFKESKDALDQICTELEALLASQEYQSHRHDPFYNDAIAWAYEGVINILNLGILRQGKHFNRLVKVKHAIEERFLEDFPKEKKRVAQLDFIRFGMSANDSDYRETDDLFASDEFVNALTLDILPTGLTGDAAKFRGEGSVGFSFSDRKGKFGTLRMVGTIYGNHKVVYKNNQHAEHRQFGVGLALREKPEVSRGTAGPGGGFHFAFMTEHESGINIGRSQTVSVDGDVAPAAPVTQVRITHRSDAIRIGWNRFQIGAKIYGTELIYSKDPQQPPSTLIPLSANFKVLNEVYGHRKSTNPLDLLYGAPEGADLLVEAADSVVVSMMGYNNAWQAASAIDGISATLADAAPPNADPHDFELKHTALLLSAGLAGFRYGKQGDVYWQGMRYGEPWKAIFSGLAVVGKCAAAGIASAVHSEYDVTGMARRIHASNECTHSALIMAEGIGLLGNWNYPIQHGFFDRHNRNGSEKSGKDRFASMWPLIINGAGLGLSVVGILQGGKGNGDSPLSGVLGREEPPANIPEAAELIANDAEERKTYTWNTALTTASVIGAVYFGRRLFSGFRRRSSFVKLDSPFKRLGISPMWGATGRPIGAGINGQF